MARKKKSEAIDQSLIEALAHTVRAEILEALFVGPASPQLIAIETGISLGNVSYHVRVLEECGCIELDFEEQIRGVNEHFYRLVPQAFLGHMDATVNAVEAGNLDADEVMLDWMPVRLDERGRKKTTAIFVDARKALLRAHGKSEKRLSRKGEPGTAYIVGFAGCEAARKPQRKPGQRKSDAGK